MRWNRCVRKRKPKTVPWRWRSPRPSRGPQGGGATTSAVTGLTLALSWKWALGALGIVIALSAGLTVITGKTYAPAATETKALDAQSAAPTTPIAAVSPQPSHPVKTAPDMPQSSPAGTDLANRLAVALATTPTQRSGANVSGLVVDENGRPVAGAIVSAVTATNRRPVTVSSNGSGEFSMDNLPSTPTLCLWAETETLNSGQVGPMRLGDEDFRGIRVVAYRSATVSGRVQDPSGRPVKDCRVAIYPQLDGGPLYTGDSAADGGA